MAPKKSVKKKAAAAADRDEPKPQGSGADWELPDPGGDRNRAEIRELELRLQRYQHKCDELEAKQRSFSSQFSSLEKEKSDIVLYLKRLLAQKEDAVTELSEQLQGLQQAKESERESFELQLSQLRREFQEHKDQLISENMVLAGKLAAVEEFRLQKEELMENMKALEEQLEKQKKAYETVIYDLEKKAVLDNNRLKKELQQHVAAVAAELQRVSERNMPETTARAIRENVSVTAQLRKISDHSKQLLEENQSLKERERQLRRELEVLEPLLKEVTRKSLSNQKVIHQLTERCRQQQVELEEYERSHQQHLQLQKDHAVLHQELVSIRQELSVVCEESGQNCVKADQLRKELEEEQTLRAQMKKGLQEAAAALKQAQQDSVIDTDSVVPAPVPHGRMTQRLIALLDRLNVLGNKPAQEEMQKSKIQSTRTRPQEAERGSS
ncbi:cilia- and flagella-associated protein 157 isoform X2 [Arapaima gigas]